jgi:twinfilin-like protein
MQSGIPVSPDLHSAFQSLTTDPTLFALPVTITTESLTPGSSIPYTSSTADLTTTSPASDNGFYASLSLLGPAITPSEPCYLLIRRYPNSQAQFVAVTYIPYNAPVRKKTLFASTRATLVRDLGSEKFASTVFATEVEEVIGEQAWKERESKSDGGGEKVMGQRERELEEVKRMEEEEKSHLVSGTAGTGLSGIGGGTEASLGGFKFPVGEGVEGALKALGEGEGGLVTLVSFYDIALIVESRWFAKVICLIW